MLTLQQVKDWATFFKVGLKVHSVSKSTDTKNLLDKWVRYPDYKYNEAPEGVWDETYVSEIDILQSLQRQINALEKKLNATDT